MYLDRLRPTLRRTNKYVVRTKFVSDQYLCFMVETLDGTSHNTLIYTVGYVMRSVLQTMVRNKVSYISIGKSNERGVKQTLMSFLLLLTVIINHQR